MMDGEFVDNFWKFVAKFQSLFWLLFVLDVVFLTLLAFAVPFVSPGTASFTILVADVAILVVVLIVVVPVLWKMS